ncbi:hypothetical protein AgCh_003280 [Apium graveolens]
MVEAMEMYHRSFRWRKAMDLKGGEREREREEAEPTWGGAVREGGGGDDDDEWGWVVWLGSVEKQCIIVLANKIGNPFGAPLFDSTTSDELRPQQNVDPSAIVDPCAEKASGHKPEEETASDMTNNSLKVDKDFTCNMQPRKKRVQDRTDINPGLKQKNKLEDSIWSIEPITLRVKRGDEVILEDILVSPEYRVTKDYLVKDIDIDNHACLNQIASTLGHTKDHETTFVILSPMNGYCRKVVSIFDSDFIKWHGAEAYPFTIEKIQQLARKDEAMRSGKHDLGTLLCRPGRDFVISNDCTKCNDSNASNLFIIHPKEKYFEENGFQVLKETGFTNYPFIGVEVVPSAIAIRGKKLSSILEQNIELLHARDLDDAKRGLYYHLVASWTIDKFEVVYIPMNESAHDIASHWMLTSGSAEFKEKH